MSTWRKVGCCLVAAVCGASAAVGATPLPTGYKSVEYLTLTGGSIDTGITVTESMELRFKFAMMAANAYKGVFHDYAGVPGSDRSKERRPNGRCVNLGAYGNTSEAKRTLGGALIVR